MQTLFFVAKDLPGWQERLISSATWPCSHRVSKLSRDGFHSRRERPSLGFGSEGQNQQSDEINQGHGARSAAETAQRRDQEAGHKRTCGSQQPADVETKTRAGRSNPRGI